MNAGYSGTPLARKLGVKPGSSLGLFGAPEGLDSLLAPLPEDVRVVTRLPRTQDLDVLLAFCHREKDLARHLERSVLRLAPDGGLWIAWPKKASGVATDLDFSVVQAAGLARGLVDNKICAVSDVYSGLRLVVRKENRAAWAAGDRG